jgi:voltage-gated potassium channel
MSREDKGLEARRPNTSLGLMQRIYEIIEVGKPGDKTSKAFDIFLIVVIVANVAAVILETEKGLTSQFARALRIFDLSSVAIFTVEYVLRIWTCTRNPRFGRPLAGRLRYVVTPLAIVDLLAILPFYLPLIIPIDLRFVRAIRLVRISRLLKIGRYSEALRLFSKVLRAKREELMTAIFILMILLVVASSLLYYAEHDIQPDKFSSIRAAMWWGVATLTTVGYGDIYPLTSIGKFLAAVISLLGIGFFALPAGILSAGFVDEIRHRKEATRTCPNCGAALE